jgi:uncharacterized membrane protein
VDGGQQYTNTMMSFQVQKVCEGWWHVAASNSKDLQSTSALPLEQCLDP